ncbi:MAG: flagellin [Desulfurococcaceae archaeon]
MGESTTITHAILTIVAILMASVFATAVLSQLNNVINSLSITLKNRSDTYRMSITIIHALYDRNQGLIYIYVKNTGEVPYSDLDNIDVFISDYSGSTDYYKPGAENITEYGSIQGVFEKGETILILIQARRTYTPPLEIKLVLSNGYKATYTTS